MELAGRVAIVTGASRGLGKTIALHLAHEGVTVALAARGRQGLQETALEVQSLGGRALVVPADVTRAEDVDYLVERVVEEFGEVDILVNSAGIIGPRAGFRELSFQEWSSILTVNVNGAFLCTQAVAPHMVRRGGGCVINISSGAAQRTGFLNLAYGVSKAALDRFTLGAADELREHRIAVVSFSAPFSDTPGVRETYRGAEDQLEWARPPEVTGRALVALLRRDPWDYTGRVLGARDLLSD